MSQVGAVTRLAVRELWISFRLLAVLAGFVVIGSVVALLPVPLPMTLERLALGLGAVTCLTAGVAAWSMAEERRAGRAGWLVTRSLPRSALLAGWFAALGALSVLGLVAAGSLGWLAASSVTLRLVPAGYLALIGAVGASLLAAIALGLLVGGVLRAAVAAALATAVVALAIGVSWLFVSDPSLVPGGAFASLAQMTEPGTATGPGLRAAGIGLACTGGLLVLARIVLERAEL